MSRLRAPCAVALLRGLRSGWRLMLRRSQSATDRHDEGQVQLYNLSVAKKSIARFCLAAAENLQGVEAPEGPGDVW
jgi:hypothetical protein